MDECKECGMPVDANEYHPYAACLMFKACYDSATVKANLDSVINHGYQAHIEEGSNVELTGSAKYAKLRELAEKVATAGYYTHPLAGAIDELRNYLKEVK